MLDVQEPELAGAAAPLCPGGQLRGLAEWRAAAGGARELARGGGEQRAAGRGPLHQRGARLQIPARPV